MDYYEKRSRLKEIFNDTKHLYETDQFLRESLQKSKASTKLYEEQEIPDRFPHGDKLGIITISKSKTYEAAMRLKRQYPDKKIAVLNFASATRPGGGVKNGSSAQEESLCRCSTLYATLDQHFLWQRFYDINRTSGSVLHSDACIYSPGVVIFKDDSEFPEIMPRKDWRMIDVISCSAPNLRNDPANLYNLENGKAVSIQSNELQALHEKRAKHIISVAFENNVDILVLGAFGCGAFRNDPKTVAIAYQNVLNEFRHCFDLIEFAVYCQSNDEKNYSVFHEYFDNGK